MTAVTLVGGVGLAARAADLDGALQSRVIDPNVRVRDVTPIKGYQAGANGAVLRVDAVLGLTQIDVAASAAGAASDATSFGRGSGLDIGLGGVGTQGVVGRAEASAPPSSELVHREAGPINLAPLAQASLLRGEAQAQSAPGVCVLGSDLGYGRGDIGEIKVLDLAGIGGLSLGVRGSRSVSRTTIVPGENGRLALQSEVRQVLAPVTFLPGTPQQFTLDVGGEWVLRATSDGETSKVEYQSVSLTPGTAPVRVLGADGAVIIESTPDDPDPSRTAGESGTLLRIPGLAEITVGGPPRVTATESGGSAGGTKAGAVVDIVNVDVLGQQVKLGHMEASSAVEAGSLRCPGPKVELASAPPQVVPGGEFDVTVKVTNPNQGTFTGTADVLVASAGTSLEIRPAGGMVEGEHVRWPVGPLGAGQTVERTAKVRVAPTSAPGQVQLTGLVTGQYGEPSGEAGVAAMGIPASGQATLAGPEILMVPEVPSVVGRDRRDARSTLEAAGYVVAEEEVAGTRPADNDKVLEQRPGGRLAPGSTVTLVVARPFVAPAVAVMARPTVPDNLKRLPASPAARPAPSAPAPAPALEAVPPAPEPAPAPAVPVTPPVAVRPPVGSAAPAQPSPAPERRDEEDREWWSVFAVALIVAMGLAVGARASARRNA